MTKHIYWVFFFLAAACSESAEEPKADALETLLEHQKSFPTEEGTIYGTWMETKEFYENDVSKRRWFFISRTHFGIGQWCFKGPRQVFSSVIVPAVADEDTLHVMDDLVGQSADPDFPCPVRFPKGYYGINRDKNTHKIDIFFPLTGEKLSAVQYLAPIPLTVAQE